MGLITTQLKAGFKAGFRPGTQTVEDLFDQLFLQTETKKLFNMRVTEATRIDKTGKSIDRALQAFYPRFSPVGNMDFRPHSINLQRVKINTTVSPDDLYHTALGFYTQKKIDRKEADIVKVCSEYLLNKAQEEDELLVSWNGVFVQPTLDAQGNVIVGPVSESRDGIKKIIKTHIADGWLTAYNTVIAMGDPSALSPTDFVKYMKIMHRSVDKRVRHLYTFYAMSTELKDKFSDGLELGNANYNRYSDLLKIPGTTVEIKGLESMAGDKMIWSSPLANNTHYIKHPENKGFFEYRDPDFYTVNMATDWDETCAFDNPSLLTTNGQ